MPRIAPSLDMIRRRADFVAATRDAVKVGGPLVGLQMRDRSAPGEKPRVGFTVTKRVGGAVERNRMKRRLRAAAAAALAPFAREGCDYVLVARRAVLDARFDRIVRDVEGAVNRVHGRGAKAGRGSADAGARAKQAADRRESGR